MRDLSSEGLSLRPACLESCLLTTLSTEKEWAPPPPSATFFASLRMAPDRFGRASPHERGGRPPPTVSTPLPRRAVGARRDGLFEMLRPGVLPTEGPWGIRFDMASPSGFTSRP